MTPAECVSAHNAAELLRNPRDRAKWLASLGDDRPDFIAALRGNAQTDNALFVWAREDALTPRFRPRRIPLR